MPSWEGDDLAKDAKDVANNPEGRWFAFRLDANSMVILEKKSIPEHLNDLECLDTPTTVDAILRELEDAGEAGDIYQYDIS